MTYEVHEPDPIHEPPAEVEEMLSTGIEPVMHGAQVISIFTQTPVRRGRSSAFVSIGLHVAAFCLIYFGSRVLPRVDDDTHVRHYAVMVLQPDTAIHAPSKRTAGRAGHRTLTHAAVAHDPAAAGTPAPAPVVPPDLNKILAKTHTLIQPDVPPDVPLPELAQLPTVVRWTAENSPNKLVIMPPPQKVTTVEARPVIKAPNREKVPADINLSSTKFAAKVPMLPPSTTSPIVVRKPEPPAHVPETTSATLMKPTPAQIVAISPTQTRETIAPVPVANSVARPVTPTATGLGSTHADKPSDAPPGNSGTKAGGTGDTPGEKTEKPVAGNTLAAVKPAGNDGAGQAPVNSSGTGQSPVNGPGEGLGGPVTRITLPKDGQFGVVVVGSSLADQYPETVDVWNGRLIYSVYLHVGAGKTWIMQYTLSRDAESPAGAVGRPEAPWPYEMVRPKLYAEDFNSDAVMVHGYVTTAGRFDHLAVVFPTDFAKAKFVLNALQQWQFRPAQQNGRSAPVEVLLIIPEETQ